MKLSLHSEYALLSLIHLARQAEPQSTLDISSARKIPAEALHEVLAVLVGSGYAAPSTGGERLNLARSAAQISVAEVIRLFDGALAPLEPVSSLGYNSAPMDEDPKLAGLFDQIQEQVLNRLEKTSIADLA